MPRQEGLRPIGESVKKIIEKIKKEREERQKKSSSPRTQPKLPGMKNGGKTDIKKYGNQKKDRMKTKPYGIEDRKIKTEKLMSQEEKERIMNKPRYYARPDFSGMKKGGQATMPGDPEKRRQYMKKKQNPYSEYDKKGSLKYTSVKKGGLTGGQKKLDANKDGKISGEDFKILRGKNNKMKGGGIAIRGTNFKGVF